MQSSWTLEREERCRELAAAGYSANEIAADLHGVTCNAVIGKIKRKKWTWTRARERIVNAEARKRAKLQRRRSTPFIIKPPLPEGDTPIIEPYKPSKIAQTCYADDGPKTLLDLPFSCCKWPVQDTPQFLFCAAARANDFQPYCVQHNRIASGGRGTARA